MVAKRQVVMSIRNHTPCHQFGQLIVVLDRRQQQKIFVHKIAHSWISQSKIMSLVCYNTTTF